METIVFLHGGGVEPENYQTLIDSLGKKFNVIAPNLYDLTETKDFSWKKFAENLDRLVGKKKVYVVGSSLGGGLALAYAVSYPQKVKMVVACEPIGVKIKRGLISLLTWTYRLLKMTVRALFYPGCTNEVLKFIFTFLKECTFNFRKLYILVNMAYNQDLEKFLPKIKAPVYLLWSKNSGVLPLWMGERLHQRIKKSIFDPSFSDRNHLWCLLEQEKVAKKVKIFLTDIKTGE